MDRRGNKPKSIPPKTKKSKSFSKREGSTAGIIKIVSNVNKDVRNIASVVGMAVIVILFAMLGSVHMLGLHHPSSQSGRSANSLLASNVLSTVPLPSSTALTTTSTPSTTSVVAAMTRSGDTTCTFLYNLTSPDSFEVNASGQNYLSGIVNYVTPDYAGLTINNNIYQMYPNKTYSINNTIEAFEVSLINLSYIPVEHSISLQFCSATPVQNLTATGPPVGFEGGGGTSTPTHVGGSSGGGGGGGGGNPATSSVSSILTTTTQSTASTTVSSYTTTVSSGGPFPAGTTVQVLYPTVLWGSASTQTYVSSVSVGTLGTVESSQYNSGEGLLFYNVSFNDGQSGWVKSTQLSATSTGGGGGGPPGDSIATGNPIYDAYDSLILQYTQKYGIQDPMLIKAEIMEESSFNSFAYNPSNDCNIKNWIESQDGSFSLLQIGRSCRSDYATNPDGSFNQSEAFNASYNLNYALALWLAQETSPPGTSTAVLYLRALAAWNNGPHVYTNTTGVYDPKGYVAAVLAKYQMLSGMAHYTPPFQYDFSTP